MTQLFEVTVTRVLVTSLHVYGNDPQDAYDDAIAIQDDFHSEEFELVDLVIDVEEAAYLPDGELAWSGGSVGTWVEE